MLRAKDFRFRKIPQGEGWEWAGGGKKVDKEVSWEAGEVSLKWWEHGAEWRLYRVD